MTTDDVLWDAIRRSLNRDAWMPLYEIYTSLERLVQLDADDRLPRSRGARAPVWKERVRNALQAHLTRGDVLWDRRGKYKLP